MASGTRPQPIPYFALFGEAPTADPGPPLHVETIRRRSRPRGWEISEHAHDGLLQAVVVRRGWVEPRIEGEATMLRGPVVICVPPGVVHAFRFDPTIEGDVITLGTSASGHRGHHDVAAFAMSLHGVPRVLHPAAEARRALSALLALARAETDARRGGRDEMLSAYAQGVVLWLHRLAETGRSAALSVGERAMRLLRFRQLVERHYRDHRAIAFYAAALGMTERSLRRLCQDVAGVTPGRLIELRIAQEARRRIIYSHEAVASIGYDLGFEDPAYFSRFVRRHAGVSPGMLRRTARVGN
jgi:AraC family transcriptional activator of pobA